MSPLTWATGAGPSRGDLIEVLEHHLPGLAWTVGRVGAIVTESHVKDFDARDARKDAEGKRYGIPAIKPGWWTVSVEHDKARRGYAYATLPSNVLGPHACNHNCGKHLCR